MRGKIDLSWHPLANLYRAPAERRRWKRARYEKCPDETYRQIFILVRGAVRDTFATHPEYLTDAGRRAAERSICKRVTGTLHGYATQVARGRSMGAVDALPDVAAVKADAGTTRRGMAGWITTASGQWLAPLGAGLGLRFRRSPEIHGGDDGR